MNHYLKCNKCDAFNEIKTPYQTFCTSCGKILDNNFPQWQKDHPEKSFEDYKKEVLVGEAEMQNAHAVKNRKDPKKPQFWISFILSFTLAAVIGKYFSHEVTAFFFSDKTPKEILTKQWVLHTYGKDSFTLETPALLEDTVLEFPPEMAPYLDWSNYYVSKEKGVKILAGVLKYADAVGAANLQGAANGTVGTMRGMTGVSDFDFSQEEITVNGIPGIVVNGSYTMKGTPVVFRSGTYVNKLVMWQLMAIYKEQDDVAKEVTDRVFNSFAIVQSGK